MTASAVTQLRIARNPRQAEAALDGALLKQTGLLATLVTSQREHARPSCINQAELMRLVKSQQSLLSACRDALSPRGRVNDAGEMFPEMARAA